MREVLSICSFSTSSTPPITATRHSVLICKTLSVFARLWERVLGYGAENRLGEKWALKGSTGPNSFLRFFPVNVQAQTLQSSLKTSSDFRGAWCQKELKYWLGVRMEIPTLFVPLGSVSGIGWRSFPTDSERLRARA